MHRLLSDFNYGESRSSFRVGVLRVWCAVAIFLIALVGFNSFLPGNVSASEFTNTYPYMHAELHSQANYEWWIDENGDGVKQIHGGNDELMSPKGFDYRNCTDGVVYWAEAYLGVTNIHGSVWSHAKNWNEAADAAGYNVKSGTTNNIEPGDIAQSDGGGGYGHVGLVTNVEKNLSGQVLKIKVAELNRGGTGAFTHEEYYNWNGSGKLVRNSAGNTWDHFIDLNGTGIGMSSTPTGPLLHYNKPPSSPWLGPWDISSYASNGSLVKGTPNAIFNSSSTSIFTAAANGQLAQYHTTGSGWTAYYTGNPGDLAGDVTAVQQTNGSIDVFGVGE